MINQYNQIYLKVWYISKVLDNLQIAHIIIINRIRKEVHCINQKYKVQYFKKIYIQLIKLNQKIHLS